MTLNEQQIAQIRAYIHSRGFDKLEVETEIIDHVASGVESQMAANPEMSIEEAIYNVHWSFGLFGFERIERAVSQGLREHLWQLYKANLSKLWSSKRLFPNLLLASLIFMLLNLLEGLTQGPQNILYILYAVIIISCFPIMYHFRIFRSWKKHAMITGKMLIPYAGAGFWVAWLLQFGQAWFDAPIVNGLLVLSSLWLSTNVFAGISMVSDMHKWTHERWLKFQY